MTTKTTKNNNNNIKNWSSKIEVQKMRATKTIKIRKTIGQNVIQWPPKNALS